MCLQGKGYGAVTKVVVPAHTVVAEYLGELIPEALVAQREEEYEAARATCTMFKLSGKRKTHNQFNFIQPGLLITLGHGNLNKKLV